MTRQKKDKANFFEGGIISEAAMLAYLNNELTAEENQKFEALLKDDPFAQDALEGLQNVQNKSALSATVAGLNKKVRERSGLKEKGGVRMHWSIYAYAAVLVGLLLGIGFVMVNYLGNKNQQVAMNEEKKAEQSLMEENPGQTALVPAEGSVETDSVAVQPAIETKLAAPPGNVVTNKTNGPNGEVTEERKLEPLQLKSVTQGTISATGSSTSQTLTYTNSSLTATSNNVAAPAANAVVAEKKATEAKGKDERKETTNEPLRGDKKAASKNSLETAKQAFDQDATPATQKVERGAIVEREEVDRVNVVTIDEAMRSFNSGDYKKSSQQFEELLRDQPKNADALYFGGISNYINGDLKKSEKNFDKLLKDGSKFVDGSKWYKANILLQKGKKEEAKKLLDALSESGGSYKERALKKKADAGL